MNTANEVFKNIAMEKIANAIQEANHKGFKVVVASDEEGNNWNEIDFKNMFFGNTNDKHIAISVIRNVDESEVFTD